MPSEIYLHDIGRKVPVDDSFFDMDEAQQGAYIHDIVQKYNSMNPTVLESFRGGVSRLGQGIQNTLKTERTGSDFLGGVGDTIKAGTDIIGGTPETNRALDPNNPFAMPTINDVAADPVKNLPNWLAGSVGDALPAMATAAAAAHPLGRLGRAAQAVGGMGAATILSGLSDFGFTADSIANRNGRAKPNDDDYNEAIAVTGATSLIDGVANYYGMKSSTAKNLVLGAVSTGGHVGMQKIAATGELPNADELLDSVLRGAVGAEGAARGIRAVQSIVPTVQRAQVGSEYSNNPDQVMSDARVGKLFQGRSGAEKQFDRGWDVNADETFKGIKADIKSHLEDLTDVSRRAGDIDVEQSKVLKEITQRAAKHNHSLAEGGQDHAYFQTEIDAVRQMGLPAHTERAFVNALRDLETVSYNSMKKNAKGPAERVMDSNMSKGIGGAIGAAIGSSIGGPTGTWIGAGIGGLIPGRVGRGIDTVTGSRQPPVLRRIEARNAYLKGKNIDPGDTVSEIGNAITDAQSRVKLVRPAPARQGSPLSARLNEAGTPRIGGWQKAVIDNVNEALGYRVVGTKELHDTIDEAVQLGDLSPEDAAALKSRGNNEVDSQLMYDLSDIMAEKYGKGLNPQDVPTTRTGDQTGEPRATEGSGIRNEYAYRQTMANVKSATQAALDGANSPEMRSSIAEIANARTPAAKKALLQKLLAENPEQADFINKQVGPITEYGPKDSPSGGMKFTSGIDPADVKSKLIDPVVESLKKLAGRRKTIDSVQPTRADGTVELTHYSLSDDLTETDPAKWGRNREFLPRDERNRIGASPPRTYFGMNDGKPGGYSKESGVGDNKYYAYVDPKSLYDIKADPEGLMDRARTIMKDTGVDGKTAVDLAVKAAGYRGYEHQSSLGKVAQLYEPQSVSKNARHPGVKSLDGYRDHLLNIGLAVKGDRPVNPAEVRKAIRDLGYKIVDDRVHFADHAQGGEDTLVARIDRPLTKEDGDKLSETLRQEAIVYGSGGKGELYGPMAAEWGPFNPSYFKLLDGSTAEAVPASSGVRVLNDADGSLKTISDASKFLDQRFGRHKGEKFKVDFNDEETVKRLYDGQAHEVDYMLGTNDSPLHWYDADTQKALSTSISIFPQLKDNPALQFFTVLMAGLHSPGAKPIEGWPNALDSLSSYLKTGKIQQLKESGKKWGARSATINEPKLIQMQKLLEHFDGNIGDWMNFMVSRHTVDEYISIAEKIGAPAHSDRSKELTVHLLDGGDGDGKVFGVRILGDKIGPFVLNMAGHMTGGVGDHLLTSDLWHNRNWNRHLGAPLVKAGDNGELGYKADPRSEKERLVQQRIAKQIADERGLTVKQVQALLWVFEQGLYNQLGVNLASTTHSQGAEVALKKRGSAIEETF